MDFQWPFLASNAVDPVKDDPTLLFDENLEGFPRLCAMLEFRRPAKRYVTLIEVLVFVLIILILIYSVLKL